MKRIGIDFQGWPVDILNLKDILLRLGFEESDKEIRLYKSEEANDLLNAYPKLLEDDGMGYGTNPMFVTEVGWETYKDEETGLNVFNVFSDVYRDNESNELD